MDLKEQIRIIAKGTAQINEIAELEKKLQDSQKEGRPLTVKLGLDPTAPDLHLGHAVVLRKIRQLQELGHQAVIILGDFTGMIGDPSGRSKTRKQLNHEEVIENAKTYEAQLFRILKPESTRICFNSEWLSRLSFVEVLKLAGKTTLARIMERDDFEKRFAANHPIGLHELFYPLMQAYDSVRIKADIEMGGTDQLFNILMGRDLMRHFGQESQVALFMPILEGTDGVEKMSKSLGNSIGINEHPKVMFEKLMSIPDNLIIRFYELCTDCHPDAIELVKDRLKAGENPRDIKSELSCEIVRLYHGEEAALGAQQYFNTVYRDRRLPDDIVDFDVSELLDGDGEVDLVKAIFQAGLTGSASEARRLISQGGVKLNADRVESFKRPVKDGDILQVGKKSFVRLKYDNKP